MVPGDANGGAISVGAGEPTDCEVHVPLQSVIARRMRDVAVGKSKHPGISQDHHRSTFECA